MSSDKKLQLELEAGAQPHCEIRKKPRTYRLLAAILGLFLFSFGMTTGVAVSQQLPIPQTYQTEIIQKYISQTLQTEFFQKYLKAPQPKRQTLWQPAVGSTWNYQLYLPPTAAQLANPAKYNVWAIDLFDTPVSTIKTIQASGSKVICYFSAGSYEPGRPDSQNFTASDKASALGGWPGEYWLKYRSTNVRNIMKARLDLARTKGCNGVDPDNMDAYNNANGWGATQLDTVNYLTFLSTEAANRGLSIGLKNSLEVMAASVVGLVQYSINEACSQYTECNVLAPFILTGKPVFNVEYPKGETISTSNVSNKLRIKSCNDPLASGLSKIIKNRNLDDWMQSC